MLYLGVRMAFDFGSSELSIRNPFKLEGALTCGRGVVSLALGILLLLTTKAQVAGEPSATEIVALLAGVIFVIVGLAGIVGGLFKLFRFYVGRNVPSDLPRAKDALDIAKMIEERVNIHFAEPVGLAARAVHSLLPRLLFVPVPVRQLAVRASHNMILTLFTLALILLAKISGGVGVILLSEAATGWLYLMGAASILLIGLNNFPRASVLTDTDLHRGNIGTLAFFVIIAVLAPVGLSYLEHNEGLRLPPAPLSGTGWLFGATLLSVLVSVSVVILCTLRASVANPKTEVAERIEHLEVGVHPSDLTRAVEVQLTKHRYLEIPNREYLRIRPELTWEQGTNRGKFAGIQITEIQPKPVTLELPARHKLIQNISGVAAHGLLLVSAIWTFSYISSTPFANSGEWYQGLLVPLTLAVYAKFLAQAVHVFWAEVCFSSKLAYLRMEGTFTEAKIATGKSIYDSTLSENTVIQSRLSYYLWTCEAATSTFAVSGRQNLEQTRWLLGFTKDEALCDELNTEMHRFGQSAQKLASVTSEDDLANIGTLAGMNKAAHDHRAKAPAIAAEEAQSALPPAGGPDITD